MEQILNKKGVSGTVWIIIGIVVFLLITSTQKITINDNQIKTASPSSCGLLKRDYDPIKRICFTPNEQINKTI